MSDGRRELGRLAEDRALDHLRGHGLELVTRNYRCRRGEVDLIMYDDTVLVFVEVRYRRGEAFGGAAESVDWRKQTRLRATAEHYLAARAGHPVPPCRFDVVALTGPAHRPRLSWIKGAFEG